MKIEFNLVQNILNTLPIGYYLGRSIPVKLDTGDSSYYVPSEDRIVIGYKMIADAFHKIDPSKRYQYDVEEIIRGLLYHEISHVILTPDISYCSNHDIINVFEDERIECLLKSFYMNTNFRKNIIFLNQLDENTDITPKNAYEAFYNVVRFHKGKQKFINRVADIIERYKYINASTTGIASYINEINALYKDITNDFKQEQQNRYNSNNHSYNNSGNNNSNNQINNNNSEQNDQNDKNQSNSSSNNSSNTDIISKKAGIGDEDENLSKINDDKKELTDNEVNNIIKDLDVNLPEDTIKRLIKQAINDSINKYYDPQLTVKLAQIIENKLKQKNKNGAAINSYSGRLNVRAVATRDDYKWWAQQNRAGHVKMYSKVHFNLFLDNSGSFKCNDEQMNKFIQSLNKVVNSEFDFDIITINSHIREWSSPMEKLFNSSGGTHLQREIEGVIKRHTIPRANNYNIVLFDGDASPDSVNGSNSFSFFDTPNSIIVTDPENKAYVNKAIRKARVIITNNYCKEFIDAILTLMEQTI